MPKKYITMTCPDHPKDTECMRIGRLGRNVVEVLHDMRLNKGTLRAAVYRSVAEVNRALASQSN